MMWDVNKDKALWAHVLPFLGWLAVMLLPGEPTAWKYALRVLVGLSLLLILRPWRWYEPLRFRHVPMAILVGVIVFVAWIFIPSKHSESTGSIYDPAVCGWAMTLIRLAGSAFVISFIEEFFWRGFLYRWLIKPDFIHLDLGTFRSGMFLLVSLLFGIEHHEWLPGILAGLLYGGLLIKTRDIWAVGIAHALTNLLLAGYVIATGRYYFW